MWADANRKNFPYLQYRPTSFEGHLVGAPQRQAFEPPVQAITNAAMFASEDIKATTGLYDASLGNKSNEQSGIAIQRRNQQAQTSNFHFVDNLTRSIKHCGRVLVQWIPVIYDTARSIKIIGEEGEQEVVKINQFFEEFGQEKAYMLDAGKYDVTVDVGPSYQTKRQEALASMIEVSKANPTIWAAAGDIMVKNMDWSGAEEIAERVKRTMPPHITQDAKELQVPPQVQAQMAQQAQVIEQLSMALQQLQAREQTKILDLQSKERMKFAELEVDLKKEIFKQSGMAAQFQVETEIAQLQRRQDMVGMNQPITPNTSFNGAGPQGAVMPNQNQQLTGGFTPGTPMEGMP